MSDQTGRYYDHRKEIQSGPQHHFRISGELDVTTQHLGIVTHRLPIFEVKATNRTEARTIALKIYLAGRDVTLNFPRLEVSSITEEVTG